MSMMIRHFAVAGLLAASLSLVGAPSALADDPVQQDNAVQDAPTGETVAVQETTESRASGVAPQLSNPLAAFRDRRQYFLAPGGSFEGADADGWQLEGGATIGDGNGGLALGGADARSLQLPPGSAATSPAFCVDLDYPTFRFFAAQLDDRSDARLQVDVIYPEIAKGNVRRAAHLRLHANSGWGLSKDVGLEPQRAGKKRGWRKVAIRFTADDPAKGGAWRVDNVLIDPRMRG
jgi:hypothetical protein